MFLKQRDKSSNKYKFFGWDSEKSNWSVTVAFRPRSLSLL